MEFKILEIKENEDGSADMTVHMDEEANKLLVQIGITAILEKYAEETPPHENPPAV